MDKIRVLLVEDEPTLAMIIKDTLDGEEFEVIPVSYTHLTLPTILRV